jgi:hypothetical protein
VYQNAARQIISSCGDESVTTKLKDYLFTKAVLKVSRDNDESTEGGFYIRNTRDISKYLVGQKCPFAICIPVYGADGENLGADACIYTITPETTGAITGAGAVEVALPRLTQLSLSKLQTKPDLKIFATVVLSSLFL